MIVVENINKSFGKLEILKDISFNVEKGEIVSIVGRSGAGKTTLLQIIATLLKQDSGKIIINNTDLSTLNDKKLSKYRNQNIGIIFQFHNLLPEFTALENICIPGYIAGRNSKELSDRALELLDFLNIIDRKDHRPAQMSGGEQQRVAVARALINNPEVILADEPSGNLDSFHKAELHNLFFKLRDKYNQTFIIVTHDEQLAKMSDRIIKLKDGQILN